MKIQILSLLIVLLMVPLREAEGVGDCALMPSEIRGNSITMDGQGSTMLGELSIPYGLYVVEYCAEDSPFELTLNDDYPVYVVDEYGNGKVFRNIEFDATFEGEVIVADDAAWYLRIQLIDAYTSEEFPIRYTNYDVGRNGIGPLVLPEGQYILYYRLKHDVSTSEAARIRIDWLRYDGAEYVGSRTYYHADDWAQAVNYYVGGGVYYINFEVANVEEWEIYISAVPKTST